jgi:hypothetical protein
VRPWPDPSVRGRGRIHQCEDSHTTCRRRLLHEPIAHLLTLFSSAKKYGIAAGLRRFLRSDGKLKQACVARYELAKSRYETAQQATWDKIKLSRQAIFDLKARHEDLIVEAEEVTTMIEQEQENLRSLQKQLKKEEKLIERNEDYICVLSGIKNEAESTDEERGLFGFVNKDLKEIREKVGIEKMEHIDLIPIADLRDIVTCLIIEGMNDHAHCVDHEITLASGHGDKTKEEVAKEVAMALGLYSVEEEEVDELEKALGLDP